jgi:hypothetical protein
VATLVQNKNFLPHNLGTTIVIDHEITTRPQLQQNRLGVDERVEGS